jgi:hypothetical protein
MRNPGRRERLLGKLGSLIAWPSGQDKPDALILSSDGRVKSNGAIVPAGAGGAISVSASDNATVAIDVNGYFTPASIFGTGSAFQPVPPCRAVSTSSSGTTLSAGQTRSFQIANLCGVPSSATAYSLNITALPKAGLGGLTVYAAGQTKPFFATLTGTKGGIVANAVTIGSGQNGSISIYTTDQADVLVDVTGYYGPTAIYSLYTTNPCRALDTRTGKGAFTGTIVLPISSSACTFGANDISAYALNATVLPQGGLLGSLTLFADGTAAPVTSTLSSDGSTVSNLAILQTTNGSVDALAVGGTTNMLFDMFGYFAP